MPSLRPAVLVRSSPGFLGEVIWESWVLANFIWFGMGHFMMNAYTNAYDNAYVNAYVNAF